MFVFPQKARLIKVVVYGRWTSYIYIKLNQEASCNCFQWSREGLEGRDDEDSVTNVQYKSDQNCHYESPLVQQI
jgi:hypothetical protein